MNDAFIRFLDQGHDSSFGPGIWGKCVREPRAETLLTNLTPTPPPFIKGVSGILMLSDDPSIRGQKEGYDPLLLSDNHH